MVKDQGELRSPNYPQSYDCDCVLRWVVFAPQGHVVKVTSAAYSPSSLPPGDVCITRALISAGLHRLRPGGVGEVLVRFPDGPGRRRGNRGDRWAGSPPQHQTSLRSRVSRVTLRLICVFRVMFSGAVWRRPPSARPVLPQRHGAPVHVRRQRHTPGLQGLADLHQDHRFDRIFVRFPRRLTKLKLVSDSSF